MTSSQQLAFVVTALVATFWLTTAAEASGLVLADGVMDGALRGALIGGAVGGVVGAIMYFTKKKPGPKDGGRTPGAPAGRDRTGSQR